MIRPLGVLVGSVVCLAFVASGQTCLQGSYAATGSPGAGVESAQGLRAGTVHAACTWDPDGPGPLPEGIVVVGRFDEIDGVSAHNIAFYDGERWSPIGDDPIRLQTSSDTLHSVCVHGGGLAVGGRFSTLIPGGAPFNNVAYWDGAAWQRLTGATGAAGINLSNTSVETKVRSFDGQVVVGGSFTVPGTSFQHLAAWSNGVWSNLSLPPNVASAVNALHVHGDCLYLGATQTFATTSPLWRYEAGGWTPIAAGLQAFAAQRVEAIASEGQNLLVAGLLAPTGSPSHTRVMRYDGTALSNAAISASQSAQQRFTGVASLGGAIFASCSDSTTLYQNLVGVMQPVGATFDHGASVPLSRVVGVFGGRLLVGGSFDRWRLDSPFNAWSAWSIAWVEPTGPRAFSSGFDARVSQFVGVGGDIYAAGRFVSTNGQRAERVARYDGGRWMPVGDGSGPNHDAWCATEFNGALIVGGSFTAAAGLPAPYVARWNGSAWEAMGALPRPCRELIAAGGTLYARVASMHPTGAPAGGQELFRWDGAAWQSVFAGPFQRLVTVGDHVYGVLAESPTRQFGPLARHDGNSLIVLTPDSSVSVMGVHGGKLIVAGTVSSLGLTGTLEYDPSDGTFSLLGGLPPQSTIGPGPYADLRTDIEYRGELFVGASGHSASDWDTPMRWNGASWERLGSFHFGPNSFVSDRCSTPFVHDGELWIAHGGNSARPAGEAGYTQGQACWSIWSGPERPIANGHPGVVEAPVGGSASLTFDVSPADAQYQWFRNGIVLADGPTESGSLVSGATTRTLTVSNLALEDGGYDYTCVVADACAPVTSQPGRINVLPVCDTTDFNGDGVFPDNLDLVDFLSVFGGGSCSNDPDCGDLDFNNDGLFPDNEDIVSLFRVFGGGGC